MAERSTYDGTARRRSAIRDPKSLACGLTLMAFAAITIYGTWSMRMGSPQSMGPAFFPRSIGILLGVAGLGLAITGFLRDREPIEAVRWRGMVFIVLSIVFFGFTIRTLGLAIAGPVSLFLASYATPDVRPVSAIVLSIAMTAFCVLLFRVALDLPLLILSVPGTGIDY